MLPPSVPPDLRPDIDRVVALFGYHDLGSELLVQLKFRNRRQALRPLTRALVSALKSQEFDAIVPVPGHSGRLRSRGYDLPNLVARRLAAGLDVAVASRLCRVDDGSQIGRSRQDRLAGARFVNNGSCRGRVLLVDDVVTTGATARACAVALRSAGATAVDLAVLAATPPRVVHGGESVVTPATVSSIPGGMNVRSVSTQRR